VKITSIRGEWIVRESFSGKTGTSPSRRDAHQEKKERQRMYFDAIFGATAAEKPK